VIRTCARRQPFLGCGGGAGEDTSRLGPRTHQQVERGEASGEVGANDVWKDEDEPKKRKLCRVAITRCASKRSIDLSLGSIAIILSADARWRLLRPSWREPMRP